MKRVKLSEASHNRMIRLLIILERMDDDWKNTVLSSGELGTLIETSAENIRKDFNTLGCSATGKGYRTKDLTASLRERLGLEQKLKAGLIGLDSWGTVLLKNPDSFTGINITAAFDSSQNRLERTESNLPLYPSYEISEVFRRDNIKIGILASETSDPPRILKRIIQGGAAGIINLTSFPLNVPEGVFYHQADMTTGFLSIVSRINGVENK